MKLKRTGSSKKCVSIGPSEPVIENNKITEANISLTVKET
jgi:hypothetical protein